jgi:sterol desaturase/sphingolipid hydroxylase (fatty acid hydroxylase superfamily)
MPPPDIIGSILAFAANTAGASVIGTFLEILIPGEKQSWASRWRGMLFWVVYILVGSGIAFSIQALFGPLRLHPLLYVDLSAATGTKSLLYAIVAYTVFPALSFFVADFFYYWMHRLQHGLGVLWRAHAVHHAIEELNAINNYHHLVEELVRLVLVFLPLNLLININSPEVVIYTALLRFSGQLTHANSKISFGWLRYVFVEPRYHRIHHSIEPRHWDKNFAALFPVFDLLFGTAYFAKPSEYPKTGMIEKRETRTLAGYVLSPFERNRPRTFHEKAGSVAKPI